MAFTSSNVEDSDVFTPSQLAMRDEIEKSRQEAADRAEKQTRRKYQALKQPAQQQPLAQVVSHKRSSQTPPMTNAEKRQESNPRTQEKRNP